MVYSRSESHSWSRDSLDSTKFRTFERRRCCELEEKGRREGQKRDSTCDGVLYACFVRLTGSQVITDLTSSSGTSIQPRRERFSPHLSGRTLTNDNLD